MRLTLSVLRCPPNATPETRHFDGGEASLGRGADNDWVLADPERHLSKRHCAVSFHGGTWHVMDHSSNGTFLNGESEAIGQGMARGLRSGDRLRFGAYEIEVRIAPAEPAREAAWPSAFEKGSFGNDEYGNDPFSPRSAPALGAGPGISLPADFDPLSPDGREESWRVPTQADNSPATSDAYRQGAVVSALPDDWADDLLPGPARTAPVATPAPAPLPPPVAAAPLADAALLAAFLRGAGLEDAAIADPERLMTQAGETLRAMVAGLRQALIARAAVKSEFRIDRTMISARGNNPLKFSADDDDALSALFGARRSDITPPRAVADALRDMRLHELATVAAMQAAVRAMVASFDPAVLMRDAGGGLPMQRRARAWEAYEALHATVTRNLADDFDSVFGKSFARAYEQAQSEIAGREGQFE